MVIRADRQANARLNRRRERAKSMAPPFLRPSDCEDAECAQCVRCGDHASRIEAVHQHAAKHRPGTTKREERRNQCGAMRTRIRADIATVAPDVSGTPVLCNRRRSTSFLASTSRSASRLSDAKVRQSPCCPGNYPLTMMVMMSGAKPRRLMSVSKNRKGSFDDNSLRVVRCVVVLCMKRRTVRYREICVRLKAFKDRSFHNAIAD